MQDSWESNHNKQLLQRFYVDQSRSSFKRCTQTWTGVVLAQLNLASLFMDVPTSLFSL